MEGMLSVIDVMKLVVWSAILIFCFSFWYSVIKLIGRII